MTRHSLPAVALSCGCCLALARRCRHCLRFCQIAAKRSEKVMTVVCKAHNIQSSGHLTNSSSSIRPELSSRHEVSCALRWSCPNPAYFCSGVSLANLFCLAAFPRCSEGLLARKSGGKGKNSTRSLPSLLELNEGMDDEVDDMVQDPPGCGQSYVLQHLRMFAAF
ncbi:hypothetical protein F441_14794 [Phytophthora nicotianae CJ01A1]|uniref:Secreted protein n=2 Tax=Phytophthora nicotianae TaxID=4792 RepID=W2WG47_PHYNI|nr:hypothetical protein L916_14455 [Phytophthora nicotianae]ETP09332.1 hypothetical protein F441_14794 [Phytophthora nicotianae CJ01A1]